MITREDMIDLITVYDEIRRLEDGIGVLTGVPAFGGGDSPLYLVVDVIWRNCGGRYRAPRQDSDTEVLCECHRALMQVLDTEKSEKERAEILIQGF